MKVFLLEDVPNVGKKHQIVDVRDGYARNFLLKKNLAKVYAANNRKEIDAILNQQQSLADEKLLKNSLLKKTLENLELVFSLKTHNNKEFHRITHHDIIKKLKSDYQIELSKFVFKNHQSFTVGSHELILQLDKSVAATLKILVKAEA
ncbi:large subunit ribosomal protein L9 [Mycoplasmoides fastidiosum]|uniref:Large ribosomal subunit protein bL9 n=1 Tax=Mycoplasmoides fastidiosum TaxID=92758 RepID=A0ABU0LZT4_9BACT|nr:50S ribosomal protein L9 [Mycoplasmoides fastidiosum]MDQ0514216.1 large subunit ribosomal protein L9 [Mycoplasmoides fastidiosum]UUD38139.1 50S ribosomal protein L9 [Mycoplasmoides fastidiosum]